MAMRKSMTRNCSRKRPKRFAPWSDLDHDVLGLIMMRLGVTDYFSLRGVCKSWRLLACENESKFMASRPPMSMRFINRALKKTCHLQDFEGRKFKVLLPSFSDGAYVGLTSGYLIFFTKETRDFRLVNPITRKQLHFPHFPTDYDSSSLTNKAILVFSASVSGWVFVVLCRCEIWFSISGKGAWKHVSYTPRIIDLYAFKGKIYTISYNSSYLVVHECRRVCELKLNPEPQVTLMKTKNPLTFEFFGPRTFVCSGDNLYVMGWSLPDISELDVDEMKWVKPCEKTLEEYALFGSKLSRAVVAVKRESWADPQSWSHWRYAATRNNGKMWYFPHQCMNVDRVDD